MRLVCPNCGAQYEVDDAAIPAPGRDVQCSNCGHTWFQQPADEDAYLAEELGLPRPEQPAPMPEATDTRDPEDPYDADDSIQAAFDAPPTDPDPTPAETSADMTNPTPPAQRRTLDDDVRSILRAEAEHEQAKRRREGTLETQGDLGLDTPRPAHVSVDHTMKIKGQIRPAEHRRDLLPDIEEINSTLRANADAPRSNDPGIQAAQAEEAGNRRGFRLGFGLSLAILGAAASVYAYSPAIIDQVPQLRAPLTSYVGTVNVLRDTIDSGMSSAAAHLHDLLSELNANKE